MGINDISTTTLKKADVDDSALVIGFDYRLNSEEHIKLHRAEKIAKAIASNDCFLILLDTHAIGFVIFDYRFFDLGWIELIAIEEQHRGKGIAVKVLELICARCKTHKIFTSTNSSNTAMQRALAKSHFCFAGQLTGLDEGDPERFYFKRIHLR